MAAVVTVAQQKGGVGKTTLVAQLAVALAQAGARVACLDIDPQGTLSAWAGLRRDHGIARGPTTTACQGWKLKLELQTLARGHDVVLVDSPPHAETEAKVAIRAAALVLVPCQPSLLDLWASGATMALAAGERRPARVVWNRVPPRGKVIEEARTALDEAGHAALPASLGNRSAFTQSMHRGLGVVETEPRGRAALEVAALVAAIRERLG